jgi:TetR/AcrR family transcriptional regulator, mexJK operon transcriptional repressor
MTCPKETNTVACISANQTARQGIDMIAARTLGRPKDMEKRCAILDAALFLFAERGVDGVPMEAIAASAGVSKVTVYANFKDKNAIIVALVERETCRIDTLVAEAVQTEGDLAQKLTRVGTLLVELISEPSRQALERCLSLEKQRNPELASAFFAAGPGHVRDLLAQLLSEAMNCGAMNLDCSRAAAEDLLGLWLGFSAIEGRYLARPPQTEFLQQRVQRGVDFFMRAHVEKA